MKEEQITGFWWGNLKEIDHLEDLGLDDRFVPILIVEEEDGNAWTGLI